MRRRSVAAVLLTAVVSLPTVPTLQAQTPETSWVLDDARGGFCIWYLTDPELAPELLPKETVVRRAGSVTGLHPVLARVVQDEPRFAEWVPSVLCLGRYAAVQSDGRVLDRAREDRPVFVSWQAMAVVAPHGVSEAGWLLTHVGGDAPQLRRAASQSILNFRDRELRNNRPQGEVVDDGWEIRVDGVKLFWTGRQVGEIRVGTTQVMSFGYAGSRNTTWLVELEQAPGNERSLLGSLRIEGKSDLAEALKGSPVRAVSAAELGGRTTMTFRRAPR